MKRSKLSKIKTIALGVLGTVNIIISFGCVIFGDHYSEASWYMLVGLGMLWMFDKNARDEQFARDNR